MGEKSGKDGNGLVWPVRKVERFADAFKNVALSNATSVAFVDRSPQRAKSILKHHPVSIPNVLLELFERRALTEDAGYLRKAANEPLAVLPVLKLKAK
jgi:hypothetical protein